VFAIDSSRRYATQFSAITPGDEIARLVSAPPLARLFSLALYGFVTVRHPIRLPVRATLTAPRSDSQVPASVDTLGSLISVKETSRRHVRRPVNANQRGNNQM
jgi:hypothetical protein